MMFDVAKAIYAGLILNELLTNTLKYAFEGRDSGIINVDLKKKDKVILLEASDNGIGFDPNISIENTESLGFKLVYMLVNQRNGTIEHSNDKGTCFLISIPSSD